MTVTRNADKGRDYTQ